MTASALFSTKRSAGDQPCDSDEIEPTPPIALSGGRRFEYRLRRDVGLVERGHGVPKVLARAEQARATPHQVAQFFCRERPMAGGRGLWVRLDPQPPLPRPGEITGPGWTLHGGGRSSPEDEALEQGIAGQSVRTVEARAGHLAGRVEPRTRRARPTIGVDAAHDVVCGRPDGDGVPRKIHPDPQTHVGDCRKPLDNVGRIEMRERQKDGPPSSIRFPHDAPSDNVAWGQVGIGVKPRHERVAITIDETRTLAPQRFGNKKSRRAWEVQRGRMKLHELEICHRSAGVIREDDPVTGGDPWVGCLAEHLTGAARRQERGLRVDLVGGAIGIDERGANNIDAVRDQSRDERVRRLSRHCRGPQRGSTARARSRGPSRRWRGARGERYVPPRVLAPAVPPRRGRTSSPSRSVRGHRRDLPRRAPGRRPRRTTHRRLARCRPRATPESHRLPRPRRCRPVRIRCCFPQDRLWSGRRPDPPARAKWLRAARRYHYR